MSRMRFIQNKTYLAIFLVVIGTFASALAIFVNAFTGGNTAITALVIAVAVISILVGSVLGFSQLLDRQFKPVADGLAYEMQDDLKELKAGRFTPTHTMVVWVAITALIFTFLVFRFHKLEATWGGLPVALVTFIAVGLVTWYILNTAWFRLYKNYTPFWIYLIPAAGIVFATWTGITSTEDRQILAFRSAEPQFVQYNQVRPANFFIFNSGPSGSNPSGGFEFPSLGLDLPSCDSDDCGILYLVVLVIALVVLAIVLIIGSAFIPHFWLLSGSVFLVIMALIALHDLRIRPGEKTKIRLDNKDAWLPG